MLIQAEKKMQKSLFDSGAFVLNGQVFQSLISDPGRVTFTFLSAE